MATTTAYYYTGAQQNYVVPAGIYTVGLNCKGSRGGGTTLTGGYGGQETGHLKVTPGETLYVYVGNQPTTTAGGYNGGGAGYSGFGGGGASDVRKGGAALSNRVIVAGGGGGAGEYAGGKGGGLSGGRGGQLTSGGGAGGTQTSGNALGTGGAGGTGPTGGGGGGYWGGEGGSSGATGGGGGGGGSGWHSSSILIASSSTGINAAQGSVIITAYDTVGIPTDIQPSGNYTVVTPNPVLSGKRNFYGNSQEQNLQWQFATNSAFTVNVKTYTDDWPARITGGVGTQPTVSQLKLSSGVWYVRARGIDKFGTYGAYSGPQAFTVNHTPSSLNQSPTAGTFLKWTATTAFSWTFADPWAGDTQTAYQIIIEENITQDVILDTGKVTSTAKLANLAIGAASKDIALRWKIAVWDTENVKSVFSNYRIFILSDLPVVTITSPATGSVVTTGNPTFSWTNDALTNQIYYRVQVYAGSVVKASLIVYDSKVIASKALSHTPSAVILSNNDPYCVVVTVTDHGRLVGSDLNTFSTFYISPDIAVYTVTDLYRSSGYMKIDWNQMQIDTYFIAWKVYRKEVNDTDWTCILNSSDSDRTAFNDWTALAGYSYQYSVTQVADRSGEALESALDTLGFIYTVVCDDYWLINPNDETKNFLLYSVTSDQYTDEIEQEVMVIIDRGRKINYGTSLGKSGSLSVQLRDKPSITARQQRLNLYVMQQARATYVLRDPFGNLLKVGMGDIQIDRIAGVGNVEFCDVTIPYTEFFDDQTVINEADLLSISDSFLTSVIPPVFTASTPPTTATVGVAYSYTFTATDNALFSITSGSLPTGLTLSTNGVLSGTPTTAATYTFVVTATSPTGAATDGTTIVVAAAVVVSTAMLNPLIYGTGMGYDSKANLWIGGPAVQKVAIKFKATTSSTLTSVRFVQRGGTGYSLGNGGTMTITIQSDDGAGHPSGTILATQAYTPGNPAGDWETHLAVTFSTPASLTAGTAYYVVFTNPSTSNYISVNSVYVENPTIPRQFKFADSEFGLFVTIGAWDTLEPRYTPAIDLNYANGTHDGSSYYEAMVANYGTITGTASMVRERITVTGGNKNVINASVRVRRSSGTGALSLTLEAIDPTTGVVTSTLETVSIASAGIPISAPGGGDGGSVWVTGTFVTTRTLVSGNTYGLRLSAPAGTTYTIHPVRSGKASASGPGKGFESYGFMDGYGEFTTNFTAGTPTWTELYLWDQQNLQFALGLS